MSSTRGGTTNPGRGERGGGYRGSARGGGRGGGSRGGGAYQPGAKPYQENALEQRGGSRGGGRGGSKRGGDRGGYQYQGTNKGRNRGGGDQSREEGKKQVNALDQFDEIFGGVEETAPRKDPKPRKKSDVKTGNDLMDLFGGGGEGGAGQITEMMTDDAIIMEDDAIVVDDAVVVEKETKAPKKKQAAKPSKEATKIDPKLKNLSEEELAILNAAHQKPLWMEDEERLKYSKAQMFESFVREEAISFDLYDPDYMSVFEVFSQNSQKPFNLETELMKAIDVRKFQEKPGGGSNAAKRYPAAGGKAGAKQDGNAPWQKKAQDEEEEDGDPEWIEFDPDKQRDKFFGHVMEDEEKVRAKVIAQKKAKQDRALERKQKAIDQAKREQMTAEQRSIIEESKKESFDHKSKESKDMLREAETLAAQIEAESYSRFDQDYEKKARNRRDDEILTDEQLENLFGEMKRETLRKRGEEMQRFAVESPATDLIDEFNEELDAMRGEDSDQDEVNGLIQAATAIGVAQPYEFGALEDDEALEKEEEENLEDVKHYSDDIREQLRQYRAMREREALQAQAQSAVGNLNEIFQNFQIVTQQRHKIKLDQISDFAADTQNDKKLDARNSLISAVFSQINPFAQFVIQDVCFEPKEELKEDDISKQPKWHLHEDLFKKSPTHEVNPDNLAKTSSQMFSVYKFYENPSMQVKSQHYRGSDDYVEVRELVPKIGFFDAPTQVKPTYMTVNSATSAAPFVPAAEVGA